MAKSKLNEVVDVNGSKVYVENGEVRVKLNEEIARAGYMDLEEARKLLHEIIKKEYDLP